MQASNVVDMIATITPVTQELDSSFEKADVVQLKDHMPAPDDIRISVQGVSQYFKNSIADLFNTAQIEYQDKLFVSDHYLRFDDFNKFQIDVDNNIFVYNAKLFNRYVTPAVDNSNVTYKLCFMSNKARNHRVLCSTVLANLFNETDICYSYNSLVRDHKDITQELLLGCDYNFDFDRHLSDRHFVITPNAKKTEWGAVIDYAGTGNNATVYNFLYNILYKNSATSIITEPSFFESGCIITEKTLMAIYSRHFMIWPGGWKLPETVKALGLDIFDDVIDHSYQYIEHPGKRVVEAFLRNMDFLNNVHLQQESRDKLSQRLNNNLALVRDIPRLKQNLSSINIT